ncbi:mitochondrial 54S ribosomal protein bL21m [Phyllosticta citriasiana]|uniref:Large ribosomal subunit protein bL21m n=1 Tax=Phyllosticta citriasiana TaxID=595635 RepID=A0ABR1KRG3_9PEZI
MFSRTIRRSIVDARSALTPTYALPIRARLSTVSNTLEPGNVPEPLINASGHKTNKTAEYRPNLKGGSQTEKPSTPNASVATPSAPSSASPLPPPTSFAPSSHYTPLSDSVQEMLPLLHAQTPHYMVAHIHAKAYMVTLGDTIRLPFLMPDVQPGDVLRLNRATVLGSRDFTLRAPASIKGTRESPGRQMRYIDDRVFVCRATVIGTESEPMRIKLKTKQRNRHVKQAKSKHKYTVLRISELTVRDPDEVLAEDVVLKERAEELRKRSEKRAEALRKRTEARQARALKAEIEAEARRTATKAMESSMKEEEKKKKAESPKASAAKAKAEPKPQPEPEKQEA